MNGGSIVWEWMFFVLFVTATFVSLWIGVANTLEHRRLRRQGHRGAVGT